MPARDQRIDFITALEFRKQEAKRNGKGEVVIDERSGEIGLFFGYKHNEKLCAGRFYLINTKTDKGYINYLYDDLGHSIATYRINNDGTKDFKKDDDVKINEVMLKRQMQIGIENIREEKNLKKVTKGSPKGGEGRNKQEKEHEVIDENNKKKEQKKPEKEEENSIKNLTEYDISIDHRTKIRLNMPINGYYLWEILDIEDKLKNKLPNGLSERAFRNGYLTVIDSKELEKIDGKPRQNENSLAISTYDGKNIIELDDSILKPVQKKNNQLQTEIEQKTINYRDGKEAEKPDNYFENTETALLEIPNVNSRFAVGEIWYLSVDKNRDFKLKGKYPYGGNIDEISIVQQKRAQNEVDINAGSNRIKTKLEAINEAAPNELEQKQIEMQQKKDPNEAENTIKDHIDELAEKILHGQKDNDVQKKRQEKLKENYNINDIKEQVKKLHDKGNSDEEIENIILNQDYENVKVRGPKESPRAV